MHQSLKFIYFGITLHVSDGLSVHHQEFTTVHTTGICQALVLRPAYGYHTTPAKPQRNTNTHRTRAIQPMK